MCGCFFIFIRAAAFNLLQIQRNGAAAVGTFAVLPARLLSMGSQRTWARLILNTNKTIDKKSSHNPYKAVETATRLCSIFCIVLIGVKYK